MHLSGRSVRFCCTAFWLLCADPLQWLSFRQFAVRMGTAPFYWLRLHVNLEAHLANGIGCDQFSRGDNNAGDESLRVWGEGKGLNAMHFFSF